MEVYVCKALRAEIVKVLNKENNTNYEVDDIKLMEFDKIGINISTSDGNSYKIDGRSIWY